MALQRKTYLIEDAMLEKMEILREKNTHLTQVDVIRAAINAYWKLTFKYGTDPLEGSMRGSSVTMEEKAKRKAQSKMAEKKAELDMKLQPKKDMCVNLLGGKVVEQPDGSLICEWQTHDTRHSHDQSVPIQMVGDYLLNNLYIPDKETVLKARPELRLAPKLKK